MYDRLMDDDSSTSSGTDDALCKVPWGVPFKGQTMIFSGQEHPWIIFRSKETDKSIETAKSP